MSLKITIEGPPGSGKTALTYLILQALAEEHINAVAAESATRDGDLPGRATQSVRMERIRQSGVTVVIENALTPKADRA